MAEGKFLAKEIKLNGKLITAEDPAMIGENFQQLTNLEYTDTHPKGVGGMTKINATTALTNKKVRSGFHFRKEQPAESHVLVQAFNDLETASYIYDNTAAVPAQGDFSSTVIMTEDSGSSVGNWSEAPVGAVAYCNKKGAYVWSGNEGRVGSFITATAAITNSITNPKDYTREVRNTIQDTDQVAVIGGGIDTYTKLLMHMDEADGGTAFDDTVGTHNPSNTGNAQADTDQAKFGISSGLFDGVGDYVSIADHADWDYSTGTLTIDTWVRFSAVTGIQNIYSQSLETSYVTLFQDFFQNKLNFRVMSASVMLTSQAVSWTPVVNAWYHVAVIRGWGGVATAWAITINGTAIGTFTANITMPNVAAPVLLGSMGYTTIIDESSLSHAISVAGSTTISNAASKLSKGSILFDGTNDWLTAPDNAGFDVVASAADNWTIDLYVKHTTHANIDNYVQQYVDANNWWELRHNDATGIEFRLVDGGVVTVEVLGSTAIADSNWHHVAVVKVADKYGVYLDGVQTGYASDVHVKNLTGLLYIGVNGNGTNPMDGYFENIRIYNGNPFSAVPVVGLTDTITPPTTPHVSDANTKLLIYGYSQDFSGWLDEYRVSKGIARWLTTFTPAARAYTPSANYWLVGSTRPLKGIKFYVLNPNTLASTLTCKEWNGYSWVSLTITDGTLDTATSTISIAKTGSVTFASTVATSKARYLQGGVLYWYQFNLSAGGADIYYCTVDAPMQKIKDIWDGVEREITSFLVHEDSLYKDNTLNVYEDSYDTGNTSSFVEIDSLLATEELYLGFSERMMGFNVNFVSGKYNSTAATTISVSYWDGSAWVLCGGISDGTMPAAISFAQDGTVTWVSPDEGLEFKRELTGGEPLYYYRVEFSENLTADVQVYYISGIPAQKTIKSFGFPLHAGGSLWLLGEQEEYKNKIIRSAYDTVDVWNGEEATEFFVGDESELVAGTTIYVQVGGNLYETILVCKKSETWLLVPSAEGLQKFQISKTIGCNAAGTMRSASIVDQNAGGRSVAIWQASDGKYMSDGHPPVKISGDIDDKFNKRLSTSIYRTKIGISRGFFDIAKWNYHWLWASGTSTTLNEEWVFDLKRGKWFEIDRGTGKLLQVGIEVQDTLGNSYVYGAIDTGYLERLDYGNTFDGNDITHTMHLGDFPLHNGMITEMTTPRSIKLVCLATNTTTNTITGTYYKDFNTTADESFTLIPQASGKRVAQPVHQMGREGRSIFHNVKLVMVTNNEPVGFEPMYMAILYNSDKQHKAGG